MTTTTQRIASLLLGALAALSALPAVADDTEIFIASSDPAITGAKPNILFIYDNSGSMDSTVVTQQPWNASTTFDGCACVMYFSTSSADQPNCDFMNSVMSLNRPLDTRSRPIEMMPGRSGEPLMLSAE